MMALSSLKIAWMCRRRLNAQQQTLDLVAASGAQGFTESGADAGQAEVGFAVTVLWCSLKNQCRPTSNTIR